MKCLFLYYNTPADNWINIGLASLIAVAKSAHVECELFDTTPFQDTEIKAQLRHKIETFSPDILAITCCSPAWNKIKHLLTSVLDKQLRQKLFIIVGGVHPTVSPDSVINSSLIDAIAIGEGESSFKNFLENVQNKENLGSIKGIWYKSNDKIFKNPPERLIENLDTLPYPDWTLFHSIHFNKHSGKDKNQVTVGAFETSRGCPYCCSYCSNSFYRKLYRGEIKHFHREKTPERVVKEIEQKAKQFNLSEIVFIDDTFVINLKRLKELSELYVQRVNLPFYLLTRLDTLNHESLSLLKKMGAKELKVGIESGNERYRNEMLGRGRMSNKEMIERAKLIKLYGIRLNTLNMIGLPFETQDMIWETIELNKKLEPDYTSVNLFSPLPGTKLYNICRENSLFIHHDSCDFDFASNQSVIKTEVSHSDLEKFRKKFPNYLAFR